MAEATIPASDSKRERDEPYRRRPPPRDFSSERRPTRLLPSSRLGWGQRSWELRTPAMNTLKWYCAHRDRLQSRIRHVLASFIVNCGDKLNRSAREPGTDN